MNKRYSVLSALVTLLIAILACNFGAGETEGVSLENLRMAFDQDGENPTTVYATSDIFYVVGDINHAPAGTFVEAKWLATQIEGYEANELIYEQTINDFTEEDFTGTIYFQLSNDDGWPVGDYKVDLYLDGNFVETVPFSVQ